MGWNCSRTSIHSLWKQSHLFVPRKEPPFPVHPATPDQPIGSICAGTKSTRCGVFRLCELAILIIILGLPFLEPGRQNHRELPAFGDLVGSRFWRPNEPQRSCLRTELPHSGGLCWYYSVDVYRADGQTMCVTLTLISVFEHISLPLSQGGWHEPASCMCSSCSQSSYWSEIHLNLSPKEPLQALEQMHESKSHFPLSLMASSNLPSAMAVVTSLVWKGKKKQESSYQMFIPLTSDWSKP